MKVSKRGLKLNIEYPPCMDRSESGIAVSSSFPLVTSRAGEPRFTGYSERFTVQRPEAGFCT